MQNKIEKKYFQVSYRVAPCFPNFRIMNRYMVNMIEKKKKKKNHPYSRPCNNIRIGQYSYTKKCSNIG